MKVYIVHRIGKLRYNDITEVIVVANSAHEAKQLVQCEVDGYWEKKNMRCREIKCNKLRIVVYNTQNTNLSD